MGRQNFSDAVYHDMKKRITDGEFPLGKKLPPERSLSEHYQVSRVPVREALKRLEDDGIISRKPNSRAVVTAQPSLYRQSFTQEQSMDEAIFLNESLRLRRLIESEAARLAAHNMDADSLKAVEQALFTSITEIRKLKNNEPNTFLEADAHFHQLIVEFSGSPFLLDCFRSMPATFTWQQSKSLSLTPEKDDVILYHSRIYECLLLRDGDASYEAMYKHLSRVVELVNSEKEITGT